MHENNIKDVERGQFPKVKQAADKAANNFSAKIQKFADCLMPT